MAAEKSKATGKGRKTSPAVGLAQAGEATLEKIIAATLDETAGFLYTSTAVHGPLIEAGLVEINPEMTNQAGEVATRATQKGISTMSQVQETSAPAVVGGFVIESNIAVPGIKRGGRSGDSYPFDLLAVGQSFFIAATAEKPEPAKSMASTVSSATARYAVPKLNAEGQPVFEPVTVKEYKLDEAGKKAKDEAGKYIVLGTHEEQRPAMVETRKFIVRSVEENGVKGARVWRSA